MNKGDMVITEAVIKPTTKVILTELYPKIVKIISTPQGDRKFKQLVGSYIDKHSIELHKPGPTVMIPFGDIDKAQYFNLFEMQPKDVKDLVIKITKSISSTTDFKLLTNNPIFWIFYCVIRYYTLKKDTKGLNTALAIYALANYPSVFHLIFPYGANEDTMRYTVDHMSNKFIIKQGGHLFGGLFLSIQHSYDFLKNYMAEPVDGEVIRFIQRIRNDQKSMLKNVMDLYLKNYNKGLKTTTSRDTYDGDTIDVDGINNTTAVEMISQTVVTGIITNGLDLKRVIQCKELAQIGLADCRFYLSKIVDNKYTKEITDFVKSVIFLYIYVDHKRRNDINSSQFLVWSSELFRKTNSNNENIYTIKTILNKWAEDTGIHKKYRREASRINYKKAIFWYFILSIQYYNN